MILLPDTGILDKLCHSNKTVNSPLSLWLEGLLEDEFAHRVILPEICDYELRRKLLHLLAKGQTSERSIRRLDELSQQLEYLPVGTEAFQLAANLWAIARTKGLPTAPEQSLDGDVILAAQASLVGGTVVTTNPKHLERFVPSADWTDI